MVVGAFMSIFLVGMLYHLVGLGRAALYRERMQDFADRGAFEGALGYARSMNAIALANNVIVVSTANVFALRQAKDNIDQCAAAAQWEGHPQVLCPPYVDGVHAAYDGSVPDLTRLIRQLHDGAAALRDATPELVASETSAMVASSGTGERRLVAAGILAPPMPLEPDPMYATCTRAGPYVRALMEESSLPPEVVAEFNLPPMGLRRPEALCPIGDLPPRGILVMSPPNQSGTEALQLRSIVIGAPQRDTMLMRDAGVRVAERTIRRGEAAPELPQVRRDLTRLGLAQAEYFSAWEHANRLHADTSGFPGVMPEENTLYMHWRARLRRLRVPVDAPPEAGDAAWREWVEGDLSSACTTAGAASGGEVCASLGALSRAGNNGLQ